MEKTVEQKVKECRELIIQGMEKTLQHKMVYMYLKDRKKEGFVKQFSVNSKDGIIKMEFFEHEKASNFYEEGNFIEKILIRPFNMYFNVALSEAEMKKFYLEGICEDNQRDLFLICRKVGYCKIYTNYASGTRGKVKATGLVSFIRRQPIPEDEFRALSQNLLDKGIKIHNYVHDKGLKCSINLLNFYEGDMKKEDTLMQREASEKAKQMIMKMTGDEPNQVTIIVKRKEANGDRPAKVAVIALLEYPNLDTTMNKFEEMRDQLVDKGETKAILFFHNEQYNSYLSLFTQGLSKPEGMTEKQFQMRLLEDFKKVNVNVIQVNIFKVVFNNSYIGRVYLRSEQAGKDFIIDYFGKRGLICHNYREPNVPMTFNINIDTKTLRKIKQVEKKAKETEEKLKKYGEMNRRDNTRQHPINKFPIANMGVPNIAMLPSLPIPNMMSMMGSSNINHIPMNLPIPMPYPSHNTNTKIISPSSLIPGVPMDMKTKIRHIIRDRENFITMDVQHVRRFISDPLRHVMEEIGIPSQQAGALGNVVLKDKEVAEIIRFLEFPNELKLYLQKRRQ